MLFVHTCAGTHAASALHLHVMLFTCFHDSIMHSETLHVPFQQLAEPGVDERHDNMYGKHDKLIVPKRSN